MDNHMIRRIQSAPHLPSSPSRSTSTPSESDALLTTPHRPKLPFQTPSMLLTPPPSTPSKKTARNLFASGATQFQLRTAASPATPGKGRGVEILREERGEEGGIVGSEIQTQALTQRERERVYQTPKKQKIHVDERVVPDAPRKQQRFRDLSVGKGGKKEVRGGVTLDFEDDGMRKRGSEVVRRERGSQRGEKGGSFVRRMEEMYGEGVLERADDSMRQKRGREEDTNMERERGGRMVEKRRKIEVEVEVEVDEKEDVFMEETKYTQDMQVIIGKSPLSWQKDVKIE
ncbi:hypothetical protein ACMFMG_007886 [Clarireedia jacksonii]